MAKYFNESDIEEFRDCYFLFAKEKHITSPEELTIIMRSLGFSPTASEIKEYYTKFQTGGRIEFATFLDIMHQHSQREKCQEEIMAAFHAHGKGTVPSAELEHVLSHFGEKLTQAEVSRLFKEAGASQGHVRCDDVLKVLLTPLPDY